MASFSYHSYSASDVGKKRTNNEDAYGEQNTPLGKIFIVCDGMGGHAAGERASAIAVNTIQQFFVEFRTDSIPDALTEAIQHANRNIWDEALNNAELSGMGTTCIVAFLHNNGNVFLAHVGDSRCYSIDENESLCVLTKDHSYVQFLIDSGDVAYEDAFDHPSKNRILKALGTQQSVTPTVTSEPLQFPKNTTLVLCTDGLNDMLRDEEIHEILILQSTAKEKVERLIQAALNKGGMDNVTVTTIQITESPFSHMDAPSMPVTKNKFSMLRWIVLLILVLFALFFWIYPSTSHKESNDNGLDLNESNSVDSLFMDSSSQKSGVHPSLKSMKHKSMREINSKPSTLTDSSVSTQSEEIIVNP
jgi:protein phosphatase